MQLCWFPMLASQVYVSLLKGSLKVTCYSDVSDISSMSPYDPTSGWIGYKAWGYNLDGMITFAKGDNLTCTADTKKT